jgi:hypothetical protein
MVVSEEDAGSQHHETEEGSIPLANEVDDNEMSDAIGGSAARQRHQRRQSYNPNPDTTSTKPQAPGRSISERSPRRVTLRRHQSVRARSKASDLEGIDGSFNSESSKSNMVDDLRIWGNSSSISIKDIMGGEKNATQVEKIHTVHNRGSDEMTAHRQPHGKTSGSDLRGGAEAKIQNIMKARRVKQGRRSDVKNSLASFLQSTGPATSDENEGGVDEEDEEIVEEGDDESIISDEEEAKKVRDSTRFRVRRNDSCNDDKSVKSARSRSRPGRTTRTVDAGGNTNNSSSHSRKGGVQRRRSKDLDDISVGGSSRRQSRRSTSRPRPSGGDAARSIPRSRPSRDEADGNKSDSGSSRRTRTRIPRDARSVDAGASSTRDARSVDGSSSRRRRSSSRGADIVQASSSTASGTRSGGGRGRRSMSVGGDDDDKSVGDKSVASRMSTTVSNRRGRRPSKPRYSKPSHSRMPLPVPGNATGDDSNNQQQPPNDPGSSLQSHEGTVHHFSRSTPTLSNHIESNPGEQEEKKMDNEEASEESSRFSAGNTAQSVLLQFDPTNVGNVRTVNQSTARKTSETIRYADGTESKLQISELPGLPTFENPPERCVNRDHSGKFGLSTESKHSSTRSLSSADGGSSVGGFQKPSSFLSTGGNFHASSTQLPGEPPAEAACGKPPRAKMAPILSRQRSGLQVTKSFMQRMQRTKVANGTAGEEVNLFSGFMGRAPRGVGHQVLDDDDNSVDD